MRNDCAYMVLISVLTTSCLPHDDRFIAGGTTIEKDIVLQDNIYMGISINISEYMPDDALLRTGPIWWGTSDGEQPKTYIGGMRVYFYDSKDRYRYDSDCESDGATSWCPLRFLTPSERKDIKATSCLIARSSKYADLANVTSIDYRVTEAEIDVIIYGGSGDARYKAVIRYDSEGYLVSSKVYRDTDLKGLLRETEYSYARY